jgi:hypothetical protein
VARRKNLGVLFLQRRSTPHPAEMTFGAVETSNSKATADFSTTAAKCAAFGRNDDF